MKTQKEAQALLIQVIQSIEREVASFRDEQAIKTGHAMNWESAVEAWMNKRFCEWKRIHWKDAIRDALNSPENQLEQTPSGNASIDH